MDFSELFADLDPNLASALERTVTGLRDEFDEKLASTRQRIESLIDPEQAAQAAPAIVTQVETQVTEASPHESQAAPTPMVAAAAPALSLDAADELRRAAMEIDVATSQASILEALSRGALRFASRVAVFVARGDALTGWSALGFGAQGDAIKDVSIDASTPSAWNTVRMGRGAVALSAGDCAELCDVLEVEVPKVGALIPFILGNQSVGAVYCDRLGNEPFSISALQLMTLIAGQTLETLPIRKRSSSACLVMTESGGAVEVAEPTPDSAVEAEQPEEATEDAGTEVAVAASEPDVAASETSKFSGVTGLETQPMPAVEPVVTPEMAEVEEEVTRPGISLETASSSAPSEVDSEPADAVASQTVAPRSAPAAGDMELTSTQVKPPDDLDGPGWAFSGAGAPAAGEGNPEHGEAQRLARLLVTEIKLYNEEAVEEGRRDGDVYSRLREDIDRSRQIFEDRIDESIRQEADYFQQALVRILGGGDPEALGI